MQKLKRMVLLAFVLCFIFSLSLPAFAGKDVVNRDRPGSITVTMKCGTVPVGGGDLSIYRVGDIVYDINVGAYKFEATASFKAAGLKYDDVTDRKLATDLAKYAREEKLTAHDKQTISAQGKAAFKNLELGLWLVVQETGAPGYLVADPFLVSVPFFENGGYIYDVDASPKVQLTPATPTPTPTPPGIPQTGQVNWPVPVLVVTGMTLFTIGWVLRYGKRNEE